MNTPWFLVWLFYLGMGSKVFSFYDFVFYCESSVY
jgi:hypothetical protein